MDTEIVIKANSVNIEPEMKSLAQLAPPEPVKEPVKIALQTMEAKPEIVPPKGLKEESKDKVQPQVETSTKADFDSKVMTALQGTSLNPRAAAPDDFFLAYSDSAICLPIFVLYLLVIVITKTACAIFNN